MPEVKLEIGGRTFPVVCQPGEEQQLARAAALLDGEADVLQKQLGRVPEARMLLMAGLTLADKMLETEDALAAADKRVAELDAQMRSVEERAAQLAKSALEVNDGVAMSEALQKAEAEAAAAKASLGRAAERLESVADMISAL